MSKLPAKRVKFAVDGFTKAGSIEKFTALVSRKYDCRVIDDKGEYTSLHLRVRVYGDYVADVILFSTGTLTLSTSPRIDSGKFDAFANDIEKIARSSTQSVSETRGLAVMRAKELSDFARSFDTKDERQRMVAVIISDSANEIVLREKMVSLGIQGEALEAGVPKKIEYLEGKDEVVYKKSEVKQVRELRNDIAHRGSIPSKEQADQAVSWSTEFVNKS